MRWGSLRGRGVGVEVVAQRPNVIVRGLNLLILLAYDRPRSAEVLILQGIAVRADGDILSAFAFLKDRKVIAIDNGSLQVDPATMESGGKAARFFGRIAATPDYSLKLAGKLGPLVGILLEKLLQVGASGVLGSRLKSKLAILQSFDEVIEHAGVGITGIGASSDVRRTGDGVGMNIHGGDSFRIAGRCPRPVANARRTPNALPLQSGEDGTKTAALIEVYALSRLRQPPGKSLFHARQLTDEVFAEVASPDALYDRPIPERNRLIFYLGHLEAFDWNLIGKRILGRGSLDASLDDLFAFGIDPPPGRLPEDTRQDWPSVAQTRRYAQRVRQALDALLDEAPPDAISMATEHRLMHLETLIYMLHQMPYSRRGGRLATSIPDRVPASAPSPPVEMVEVPAGVAQIGRRQDGEFGWDNEFPAQRVSVPAFAISTYKITNGQYLRYVQDGGSPPPFWRLNRGRFTCRRYDGEFPLPLDWPVYVTQLEAELFAAWFGKKLPSEAQYDRAAWPDGESSVGNMPSLANRSRRDPVPVGATPLSRSGCGVVQPIGNGWEWTRTVFGPQPGFEPQPWYPGYSSDFFDGKHFVVKGASSVTSPVFIRRSFRNWFRAGYPYAYTSFRLVESSE